MTIAHYRCNLGARTLAGVDCPPIAELPHPLGAGPFPHQILIWNNNEPFGAVQLSRFPELKAFISWGTHDSLFDAALLRARGITVMRVDFYATEAVAEYALALLMQFERQLASLSRGNKVIGSELHGKKVGIIGLGKIGARVASMCYRAFGCEIYYFGRNKRLTDYAWLPLRELFKTCDYVFVTAKARDFHITQAELSAANPDLVIVSIARDDILPFADLLPLLHSHKLRGFVSDTAPIPMGDLPANVLLMPHVGYLTERSCRLKQYILAYYLQQLDARSPRRIHVARHGETTVDVAGVLSGRRGAAKLTAKGRQAAIDLANYAADKNISAILAAPDSAAGQAAELIAKHLGVPVTEVPAFAELDIGVFEGISQEVAEKLFAQFFSERAKNAHQELLAAFPAGESPYDVYLRVLEPLLQHLAGLNNVLIISSEQTAKVLRGIICGLKPERMVRLRQSQNEVACFTVATRSETLQPLP